MKNGRMSICCRETKQSFQFVSPNNFRQTEEMGKCNERNVEGKAADFKFMLWCWTKLLMLQLWLNWPFLLEVLTASITGEMASLMPLKKHN